MNRTGSQDGHGVRSWLTLCLSAALLGGAVAVAASPPPYSDFAGILAEERSAVAQTADLRTRADRSGDRIRETCAYERLRGIMQAVDSTQIAQVAWEGAKARGDEQAASAELARAQKALGLVRELRNEADNCVGRELASVTGSNQTVVTVETTVADDDPNAGPVENWTVRPPRLEIPDRSFAASPFSPTQIQ